MKIRGRWIIVVCVLVVTGLVIAWGVNLSTPAQHFTAKLERGGDPRCRQKRPGPSMRSSRCKWGRRSLGPFLKLNVDFNSRVHKGDVVALIDPAVVQVVPYCKLSPRIWRKFQGQPHGRESKSRKGTGRVGADQSGIYDRALALTKSGVQSQQQLDLAKANYDSANATVNGACRECNDTSGSAGQSGRTPQWPWHKPIWTTR